MRIPYSATVDRPKTEKIAQVKEPKQFILFLHPDVKVEILRRRDEVNTHPELLEPWEGTTERARARLHELRRQKLGGDDDRSF